MRIPLHTTNEKADSVAATRSCGSCYACCVLPRIPQLGKRGYTSCSNLTPASGSKCCGCYDARPEVCREYLCLWRSGHIEGDERRRPDNLGLMFSLDQVEGKILLEAWELWEGATKNYPGRGVLDSLASQYTVVVRYYGVPCSLLYEGPLSFVTGDLFSHGATEEPVALGRALWRMIMSKYLEMPDSPGVREELDALLNGEKVEPPPFRIPK